MRILLALVLLVTVTGCAAFSDEAPDSADGVQVATAFYPLQYVAQRVAGDLATVENLTQPGAEPHDLELTVAETADLAGADLVVYQQEFQPAVDEAVGQNAGGEVLDVTDVVELRRVAEHSDEAHAAGGTEEHADEEHDHGDVDPHFWLDPVLLADVGDEMAARLADLDPDHAQDFAANARDLRADLEELDTEYAEGLAGCERDTVVVNHDAFGYLAKYDVHLEPIVGLSPDAEPTPADLSRLQDLIRDDGITTVFAETLVSRQTAETLADDLGLTVSVLDPIEGLRDADSDENYLSLMRANLAELTKANGC